MTFDPQLVLFQPGRLVRAPGAPEPIFAVLYKAQLQRSEIHIDIRCSELWAAMTLMTHRE